MKITAAIAGLLLTGGCTAVPSDVYSVPGGGLCDAASAQMLVGKAASSAIGAEALRLTGAASLRWIAPDTAVTMDFRPDRLNIETDAQNRVRAIRCG